jgi:hypothetical protein
MQVFNPDPSTINSSHHRLSIQAGVFRLKCAVTVRQADRDLLTSQPAEIDPQLRLAT